MKNDRKKTSPLIAAHSAKKKNQKPAPSTDNNGKEARVSRVAKGAEGSLDISSLPEQNPNPVLRFDSKGELLYCNTAAAPLLDFWRNLSGRTIPEDLQELIKSSFDSGTNKQTEIAYAGKIFSTLLVPLRESDYVNVYCNDITERKQTEVERNQLLQREQELRANAEQSRLEAEQAKARTEQELAERKLAEAALGTWTAAPLPHEARSPWMRYGMAVVSTVLALILRLILGPIVGDFVPLSTLYGAVAFSVWYGGVGPALLSVIVGYLGAEWFIIAPRYVLAMNLENVTGLGLFLFSSAIIMSLGEAMRRAQRHAHQTAQVAAERQRQTEFRMHEQQRAEEALHESETQLKVELADSKQLQRISSQLIREDNINVLYLQIIDAAIALMRSDMASLQMLYPNQNELQLLASKGFDPKSEAFWERVHADSGSTCGMALDLGERVIVYDVETSEFMAGTPDLDFYRISGIRAVQSTPLISRDGHLVGMISTHWREIHQPTERELQMLDVLARQAADLIERKRAEEELRESQQKFSLIYSNLPFAAALSTPQNGVLVDVNSEFERIFGYSKQDVIGKTSLELEISPDAEIRQQILEEIQMRGSARGLELHLFTKPAGMRIFLTNIDTVTIGEEKYILQTLQDITERKQIEQTLARERSLLERFVETMPVMVSIYDPETDSLQLNEQFEHVIGWNSEEVTVNSLMQSIYPDPEYRNEVAQRLAAAESDEWVDVKVTTHDGRTLDILWANISVPNGRQIGMGIDITERKRGERALSEFARRQTALYRLTDQLHRTNTLDDVFNASLDAILNALQCDRASILLFDHTQIMHFVAWRGLSDAYRKATDGHSPWKYGKKNPEHIFYNDIRTADLSDSLKTIVSEEGIGSLAFIPLVFEDRLIGKFMVYFNTPHIFNDDELDLGLTIGRQLAAGVERKRAEESLRASEEKYRSIVETANEGIWEIDKDTRTVFVNSRMAEMLGYTAEEMIGRSAFDFLLPDDVQEGEQRLERAKQGGSSRASEFRYRRKDHSVLWTVASNTPKLDEQGNFLGAFAMISDITERKNAEEALRQSEERFSQFMEHLPGLAWIKDIDGCYIYANAAAEEAFRTPREQLYGRTDMEVFPAETAALFKRHDEQALKEEKGIQVVEQLEQQDGVLHYSLVNKFPIPGPDGRPVLIGGTAFDITDRKRAEDRLALLAEVSELTRNAEDGNELMTAVADLVGRYLGVKRCLFNEIDIENDLEVVHRDYHDGMPSVAGEHKITEYSSITTAEMITGKTVVNRDSRIDPRTAHDYERSYVPNGERAYIAVPLMREERWVASLWVSDDRPRNWSREDVSLLETIAERTWTTTEKLRIHAALRDSEERLRVTFNTTAVGFATLAPDTRFLEVNDAFCNIVGYSREELLSMNCDSLTHPDFVESTQKHVAQLLAGEVPSFVLEKLYIRKDGTQIWVQNSVSIVHDEDGNPLHLITICQDVTDRKQTEEELRQLNLKLEDRVERRTFQLRTASQLRRLEMVERRQAEDRFFKTFNASPAAMSITRFEDGLYRNVNPKFIELLGYDFIEIIGHTSLNLRIYRNANERLEILKSIRENKGIWEYETQLESKTGRIIDVTISAVEIELEGEAHILSTIVDITERNRIMNALRSSEQQLRTLFNVLPVGVSYVRPDGQVIQSNAMQEKILGITHEGLMANSFTSRKYIRPDGSLMAPSEFASIRALTEQRVIQNVETGVVKEDGQVIWTSVSAAPVSTPEMGAVIITADVTERKHMDDELRKSHKRYQVLSQRLVEIQEEERRTISRELHDRVGQTLAALNLNLNFLNSQLPMEARAHLGNRLKDAIQLTEETVSTIRDVMADLRPPALDDYGLEAALNAYANTFSRRSGIQVVPIKTGTPLPSIAPSIELTLLRIAQEALTNVARHSHANRVSMTLGMEGNSIRLTIEDNGEGILSWQKANRPGSHGLKIMRERAEAFEGVLHIHSSHKKGTMIEVKIPVSSGGPPDINIEVD